MENIGQRPPSPSRIMQQSSGRNSPTLPTATASRPTRSEQIQMRLKNASTRSEAQWALVTELAEHNLLDNPKRATAAALNNLLGPGGRKKVEAGLNAAVGAGLGAVAGPSLETLGLTVAQSVPAVITADRRGQTPAEAVLSTFASNAQQAASGELPNQGTVALGAAFLAGSMAAINNPSLLEIKTEDEVLSKKKETVIKELNKRLGPDLDEDGVATSKYQNMVDLYLDQVKMQRTGSDWKLNNYKSELEIFKMNSTEAGKLNKADRSIIDKLTSFSEVKNPEREKVETTYRELNELIQKHYEKRDEEYEPIDAKIQSILPGHADLYYRSATQIRNRLAEFADMPPPLTD